MQSENEILKLAKNELRVCLFLCLFWGIQALAIAYLFSFRFESNDFWHELANKIYNGRYEQIVISLIFFLIPILAWYGEKKYGRKPLRFPPQNGIDRQKIFLIVSISLLIVARTFFRQFFFDGAPKVCLTLFTILPVAIGILKSFRIFGTFESISNQKSLH